MVVCLAREDLYFGALWWEQESDSCGRNGRWKGLIFRHNMVHVQNQGAVLRKSSSRGVHPSDFSARQGENERRPISSAYFTLDENGYPVVSPNGQGALCCVVYPFHFSPSHKGSPTIFLHVFSATQSPHFCIFCFCFAVCHKEWPKDLLEIFFLFFALTVR